MRCFACVTLAFVLFLVANGALAAQVEADDGVVAASNVMLLDSNDPEECPCEVEVAGDSVDLDYVTLPNTPSRVALWLGPDAFDIEVDFLSSDGRLQFLHFDFGDRSLYGVQASAGVGNTYNNYFYYDGNRFRYLGVFPALRYSRTRDLYVSYERDGASVFIETRYLLGITATLWKVESITTGGGLEEELRRPQQSSLPAESGNYEITFYSAQQSANERSQIAAGCRRTTEPPVPTMITVQCSREDDQMLWGFEVMCYYLDETPQDTNRQIKYFAGVADVTVSALSDSFSGVGFSDWHPATPEDIKRIENGDLEFTIGGSQLTFSPQGDEITLLRRVRECMV